MPWLKNPYDIYTWELWVDGELYHDGDWRWECADVAATLEGIFSENPPKISINSTFGDTLPLGEDNDC